MPQPSYEYALGRISVLSTHLRYSWRYARLQAGSSCGSHPPADGKRYGENQTTEQESPWVKLI